MVHQRGWLDLRSYCPSLPPLYESALRPSQWYNLSCRLILSLRRDVQTYCLRQPSSTSSTISFGTTNELSGFLSTLSHGCSQLPSSLDRKATVFCSEKINPFPFILECYMNEMTVEIHNLIKTVATLHYFHVSLCLQTFCHCIISSATYYLFNCAWACLLQLQLMVLLVLLFLVISWSSIM
jgi:hypothetical protein